MLSCQTQTSQFVPKSQRLQADVEQKQTPLVQKGISMSLSKEEQLESFCNKS